MEMQGSSSISALLEAIQRREPGSSVSAAEQLLPLVQAGTVPVGGGGKLQSVLLRALASDDETLVEACGRVLAELSKTRASPPERTREVCLPGGPTVAIRELADFEGDNHGAQVWTCAALLSTALVESVRAGAQPRRHRRPFPSPSGKRVLELGAGCGLCGLVAAKLGAREVVITDCVERLIQNIAHNIQLQEDDDIRARCTAQRLDWRDFSSHGVHQYADGEVCLGVATRPPACSPPQHQRQYELLIGADLLLNEYSAVKLLPQVIDKLMSPTGECVLSLAVRSFETLASFREALTRASLRHTVEDQVGHLTDWVAAFDGWDSIRRYPGGIVFVYIWRSALTDEKA